MSQKVSRKAAVTEDKEKRQTDSPVKEMKKKMAANAEKEKQAAEKAEKSTDKAAEKQTEKNADKSAEKPDKTATDRKPEKNTDKSDKIATDKKSEKVPEKPETKATEKKSEKNVEKKEPQAEKSKEDANKEDKAGKSEKSDQKRDSKPKVNGREQRAHNGVSDVTLSANGVTDDAINGTVSAESEDDDVMLVIDDQDQDELFPELTYDDASDVECFEPPTPESAPSRSITRRSQVKAARTPETPRPASDKTAEDPKDSKVLKLNDAPSTDRKLRSADSPKPEAKKDAKKPEEQQKQQETEGDAKTQETAQPESEKTREEAEKKDKVEMEVVIEVEGDAEENRSKRDTNYSKSRVKVSPYRRSMRIADQTNTSVLANYTGNNTTMEMDITETSSLMCEEPALDDSSYLRGLRSIRGRNSYKPLKELTLRHVTANRSTSSTATLNTSESHCRPTGTVVGRKRKPDNDDVEVATEVTADAACTLASQAAHKRMRLIDRLAVPFRRTSSARNAEIVGINTDLPLSAPVVSAPSFDPESLKAEPPVAVPLPTLHEDRDAKRCAVM